MLQKMAVDSLLRPGEEEWQGAYDNLCKRFAQLEVGVVADTLRQNNGHAGRTAQALRKLPDQPASGASTPPSASDATKAAPAPASTAKEIRQVKASPPSVSAANAPTSQTGAPQVPCKTQAPPPPDSKLIFVAALQGDVQQLNHLIAAGTDLNGRYTGRPNKAQADKIIDATPLHLVVTMGNANVAEVLLRHGADFKAKMRRDLGSGKPPEEQYAEMTPLHLAAMEGHTNIVEMLLASGADKTAKMQLIERKGGAVQERAITPLEIAHEMVSKGHSRDSVISLLNK